MLSNLLKKEKIVGYSSEKINMERVIEPELMIDYNQCMQYYKGWRDPLFDIVVKQLPELSGNVADLGSGPGQFLKILRDLNPDAIFDGIDGSNTMHNIAKDHLEYLDRVNLIECDINDVTKQYDFIFSINTLHHIHNPVNFWNAIKRMSKENTKIFVMDLLRPDKIDDIKKIIDQTVKFKEDTLFVSDYENSLKAAFNKEEIVNQVKDLEFTIKTTNTFPNFIMISNYG